MPGYPAYGYPGSAPSARWPRYLKFLKKLWWVPVLTLAIALSAAAVYVVLQPPAFKSVARLWVSGKMNLKENSFFNEELQFFFGTQLELLQSDKIQQAAQVRVQTMNPNLAPSPVKLRISQPPKSAIFLLDARGEDPTYTQTYLNALIDEYLTFKKQARAGPADDTLSALSEKIFDREKDLKAGQEKLNTYQRENNVPVLQEQAAAAGQYLARLNAEMSNMQLENDFLGAVASDISTNLTGTNLLNAANSSMLRASAITTANVPPEVALARQQLQLLELQRDELAPFLRPAHPKMLKYEEDIARAGKLLALYEQRSRDEMEPTRQARQLKIAALNGLIKEWEAKLLDATRRLADFEQIKANVLLIQSSYDKLLLSLQSLDVSKSLDQEVVSVMERASPPEPAKPSLPRTVAVACVAGLFGGIMLVLLVARFDDRFTTVNELMEQFDEEIVGQVPDVRRGLRKRKLELVEPDDERHMFAESYRNIRSSILYMPADNVRPKMLLVTSAIPNEGKSTVSANLAKTMAFAGGRVLLIDGDMRKGKLHEYFGVERGAGLSKLLHEDGKMDDYLVPTSLPNLFIIPSGDPIPDASECFLSERFERLLKDAHGRFDQIIMDSAPVFAADDAPTLAPKMDGVLFVIRGSFTKAAMAHQALDILYQRQARVLGLVFNRADAQSGSYYYYKYADYYYNGSKNGKAVNGGKKG